MSIDRLGYGRPPQSSRFQKGRSGNPRGRPPNRHREKPYNHVLGQLVTIREGGRERRVTAAEAFLLQLTKKGLEGCSTSARSSLQVIEAARAARAGRGDGEGDRIRLVIRTFGLCSMFEDLGIGVLINGSSKEHVRLKLKPWIVQLAVDRLPFKAHDISGQQSIFEATQTPTKVRWPEWWEFRG